MIFHIRNEEKKVVKNSIVNLESVLEELEGLSDRYKKESHLDVDSKGLLKFMRKGRFNFFDGNSIFSFKFKFEDLVNESIDLTVEEKDGVFYIKTLMVSDRKDEGKTEIELLDNIELMSMKSLIERIIFKFAEITMKVSYKYETDSGIRAELEDVAKKLNWLGDLKEEEIKSAELELSNLDVILALGKESNKELTYKINEGILGVGFKKYRSNKEICRFKMGNYEENLSVVKGEDGKYYYEVSLTKVDTYNGKDDYVTVYERHEVTPYGYERIIRDVIPVYVSTLNARLS